MSVSVTWDNAQKTIVCLAYQQPWTIAEFDAGQIELKQLLSTVAYPVDIIIDISKAGTPPPNAINRFMAAAKNRLRNQGKAVVVGADMFRKSLVQTVDKLTHSSAHGSE